MKREYKYWPHLMLLVLVVVFSAGYLARAQNQESGVQAQEQTADAQSSETVVHQTAGTAGVSVKSAVINFSKLASQESLLAAPYREPKAIREPGRAPRNKAVPTGAGAVLEQQGPEANAPGEPLAPSPAPAANFKALEDSGTSIPPDTHGAAGPNHLMVTLNTQIRIQNKTGGIISTVTLDAFWAALGNPSTFDPKVLYDPFSNRWMFTCTADGDLATSSVLIGVTQTSDPTGNWKLYKVDADNTNAAWADYPSLGFNKNWIVVTVNMFGIADGTFKRTHIYAFNKANLYAFGATATHKVFSDVNGFTMAPVITYDNALNPLYLVEDWDGHTQLRISSLGGTAAAPTYSAANAKFATVTAANSWTFNAPSGDFAPQLGSTRKIMTNDARIQNVVYRAGSLWCTHTIFLPNSASPTRAAVQWWELAPAGTIKQRGRIDDPTGQKFFAFPSIAVNKNKDVLIGYSRFSSQQYASANFAFRAGTDPLNTLRDDRLLKAGSAPYNKDFGSGRNRWGDYSSTVVDPVNDLDMWTVQEHAAPVSGGSSRWGTWWGRIAVGPSTPTPFIQLGTVTATDGNTADADTIIEPGENGNKLKIQLKNTGNGAATAVSAKLTTSTAGVTITTNTSAYPNLAATTGSGFNTTLFAFNVASTVPCGQPISFILTVTYTGGGSPATLPFTVQTGKPGAASTKIYTGALKPIPDNNTTGVNIPLVVSGLGRISDLNFKIGGTTCSTAPGLNHTWVGDLVITLKSPQGTVVTLMNRPGGVNNSGINFCNTVLDDDGSGGAAPSIQNVTPSQAPYTGTFQPASPLSAFDGQNANGTWTLNVSDRAAQDTGSVRSFSLIITAYACSTTAQVTPVETQSDRALASLQPASGNVTAPPSQIEVGFNPTAQVFSSTTGQVSDIASLTGEPYLAALFVSIGARPSRIEDEPLRSAFKLKRYDYLMRLLAG